GRPAWHCQPGPQSGHRRRGRGTGPGTVLTVRATDGDAGANANILYRLLNGGGPNEVFEIDARSGVIRTRGAVDREAVEAFELLVEAADQGQEPGPRSATATVRIAVEDDNDNAPEFTQREYASSSRGWRPCWGPPATASSSSTSRRTRTWAPRASST
uniref:Cadherin domain-containing protein n=1 Tax=Nothoprocta perdicaria TaxID=30464 RepID=A0A8C6ZFW7_NOTPE